MGHTKGNKKHFFYSFLCSFLSTLIACISITPNASALSDLQKVIFKENNIMFWNPDENYCFDDGYIAVDAEAFLENMGSNEQTIFSYLTQNGFSNVAAAAIMGNLRAESGAFNPRQLEKISANSKYPGYLAPENFRAYENGKKTYSGGLGLAQWTYPSRVKNLQDFADSLGLPVVSLSVQTRFLYKELTGYGITPSLLNSMSLRDATSYVLKNYERPSNMSESVVDTRTGYAEGYINYDSSAISFDDSEEPGNAGIICISEQQKEDEYLEPYEQMDVEELIKLLEDGGLSYAEAVNVMEEYKRLTPDQYAFYNIDPNIHNGNNSPLQNCVAFVRWYVKRYYNYDLTRGNGNQVVSIILKGKPANTVPKAGAVMSYNTSTSSAGHTAVVLGIHGDTMYIGEASYHYGYIRVRTVKTKDYTGRGYTYAYPEDMGA